MTVLAHKNVLLTGGSRGIGEATARLLAAQGARVHLTYGSSKQEAEAVARDIGGQAHLLDANAPESMAPFAAAFLKEHGAPDILVHNAGVFTAGPIEEHGLEELQRVLRVNVESIYALTHALVPHMKPGSRIIVISSVLGERASAPNLSIYNASKFAATGLARSWAKDLGQKSILVNAVQPGPIHTQMNPDNSENPGAEFMKNMTALGRYGTPEDIAHTVAFLAGPGASYITGATLNVDGGWNA